jgi:Domain of unknown function (DUF4129)
MHLDVVAQKKVQFDSSSIEIRHFTYGQIKTYREQKEFDYREQKPKSQSLWDRFWAWFWEQFYRLSQKKSIQRSVEIFVWIVSISLILFAIYRLTGMEKRFFLQGKGRDKPLSFLEIQEDIHSIDFNSAIEEAIEKQQYRVAIRLMYLQSLKELSDKCIIDIKPNKTNFDYAAELKATPYSQGFENITLVYEYAWYGEFPVNREMFNRLRGIFSEYEKNIFA